MYPLRQKWLCQLQLECEINYKMHIPSRLMSLRSGCHKNYWNEVTVSSLPVLPGLCQISPPHQKLAEWEGVSGLRYTNPFMGQMTCDITEAQSKGEACRSPDSMFCFIFCDQVSLCFFLWSILSFKEVDLLSVLGGLLWLFFSSLLVPLSLEPGSGKWLCRPLHTVQKSVLKCKSLSYYPIPEHFNGGFLPPYGCLPPLDLRDSHKGKGKDWTRV